MINYSKCENCKYSYTCDAVHDCPMWSLEDDYTEEEIILIIGEIVNDVTEYMENET